MKVYVDLYHLTGGPSVFRDRLCRSLSLLNDIKIVHDLSVADVELSFIKRIGKGIPFVLRVDGCYYFEGKEKANSLIVDSIRRAASVVYQSEFSKRMCDDILSVKAVRSDVVYNGIDIKSIEAIAASKKIHEGSFVACAKWRDSKRPNSTIRGFLEATTNRHLYIIGDGVHSRWKNEPRVHLLGKLGFRDTIAVLKACQYMMHLCYIDSCPNSVVEGLACGLNVVCTNLGGTPELVQQNGVVINIDRWAGSVCRPVVLDRLDTHIIAKGVVQLMKLKDRAYRPDLDINAVAKTYSKILRKAMCQ